MPEISTIERSAVNAGDTVRWLRVLPEYQASAGWVLTYTLLNAAGKITITATAQGADHLVNVPAATTAAWAAGDYSWRAQTSKAGEVYTIGEGRMTVYPSFSVATLDTRSANRQALDAVETFLRDPNNIAAAEYEVAGRRLKMYALPDLWKHRDRLRFEVSKEEAAQRVAAGLPDSRRVFVRFGA